MQQAEGVQLDDGAGHMPAVERGVLSQAKAVADLVEHRLAVQLGGVHEWRGQPVRLQPAGRQELTSAGPHDPHVRQPGDFGDRLVAGGVPGRRFQPVRHRLHRLHEQ